MVAFESGIAAQRAVPVTAAPDVTLGRVERDQAVYLVLALRRSAAGLLAARHGFEAPTADLSFFRVAEFVDALSKFAPGDKPELWVRPSMYAGQIVVAIISALCCAMIAALAS